MEELIELLVDHFPNSTPQLEENATGRISGFLIWDGFAEMPQRERQKEIWTVLRDNLTVEEQQLISAILTLTPTEEQVMLENE